MAPDRAPLITHKYNALIGRISNFHMKKVALIRGPLGVGKTTISKLLAEKYKGQHISIDEVIDQIKIAESEDENGGIPLKKFILANELILPRIRENIGKGLLTIIDGNFYHLAQVDHLTREIPEAICFTLKASVEDCIARDRNRPNSYGEDAAKAVHRMVSSFDYGTIIEVGNRTADEVLSIIEEDLNK